jgi:chromosome segregation ATPase
MAQRKVKLAEVVGSQVKPHAGRADLNARIKASDKKIADAANQASQLGSNVSLVMQALNLMEAEITSIKQRLDALERTS